MYREANAVQFPRLVWSSIVVAALSEWEVVLRGYPEYLRHHLKGAGLPNPDAVGKSLMDGFKRFVKSNPPLAIDFSAASWCAMNNHRLIRNIIVHWGGHLSGRDADQVEQFVKSAAVGIERQGDFIVCGQEYASSVVDDALDFSIQIDEAVLAQYPHLWRNGA